VVVPRRIPIASERPTKGEIPYGTKAAEERVRKPATIMICICKEFYMISVPVPEAIQTRLAFLGGTRNAVAGEKEQ
jgi:hypothetical protein